MRPYYLIKSEEDIKNCPQFGYEQNGNALSIRAVVDGEKKPLKVSLGSKVENLGLVVKQAPDEVKSFGNACEKEKLVLALQRDSDIKLMQTLDQIFQKLGDVANARAKSDRDAVWYCILGRSRSEIKLKVHPIETLYSEDGGNAWRHIGSGENYKPPFTGKKRKEPSKSPPAKLTQKNKNTGGSANIIDTSVLLSALDTPVSNALDTKELLRAAALEMKQTERHYKIYEGDEICTTIDVGDIWSMNINGKPCRGVTLKCRHMVVLTRRQQYADNEDEESENELPEIGVFD
jgi:hypothetical protein